MVVGGAKQERDPSSLELLWVVVQTLPVLDPPSQVRTGTKQVAKGKTTGRGLALSPHLLPSPPPCPTYPVHSFPCLQVPTGERKTVAVLQKQSLRGV